MWVTGSVAKTGKCVSIVPWNSTVKGKGKTRTILVYGNLPKLFKGMSISLDLNDSPNENKYYQVNNFNLTLDDEKKSGKTNKHIISENMALEDYLKTYDRFMVMKDKFTWKEAETDTDSIYKKLSFEEADEIHKKLIDNPNDKQRLDAIKYMAIAKMEKERRLNWDIMTLLDNISFIQKKSLYRMLSASEEMQIVMDSDFRWDMQDGRFVVINAELERKENFVNQNISSRAKGVYPLLTREEIDKFKKTLDFFCDEQLNTLDSLLDSMPVIITGGAGVGKTSVIKAIMDCYSSYYGAEGTLLVAPTGKAARRLAEKTGYETGTIHKALRKSPADDFVYYHNKNKLPAKLIIVDESSMVDTRLMYDLLSAAKDEAKLIFVGDSNQLQPVGYGSPFFDFQSVIPVFQLTQNHRQGEGTDILRAADEALNRKPITSGRGVYIKTIKYDEIRDTAKMFYNDSTQLISPRRFLKTEINSYLKKNATLPYEKGDKVIFGKNTEEYCNGDMGYVIRRTDRDITVRVDDGVHTVSLTPNIYKDDKEIDLGYCITVHKMQGSECDRVVVFLEKGDLWSNDASMLYTAITRAKKEIYIFYYEK